MYHLRDVKVMDHRRRHPARTSRGAGCRQPIPGAALWPINGRVAAESAGRLLEERIVLCVADPENRRPNDRRSYIEKWPAAIGRDDGSLRGGKRWLAE